MFCTICVVKMSMVKMYKIRISLIMSKQVMKLGELQK